MTFLRHLWDSILSTIAALLSAGVAFIPAWSAHMAIDSGLVPIWVYLPIAGLIFAGCVVSFAFLRKAKDGVSPFRERRRR